MINVHSAQHRMRRLKQVLRTPNRRGDYRVVNHFSYANAHANQGRVPEMEQEFLFLGHLCDDLFLIANDIRVKGNRRAALNEFEAAKEAANNLCLIERDTHLGRVLSHSNYPDLRDPKGSSDFFHSMYERFSHLYHQEPGLGRANAPREAERRIPEFPTRMSGAMPGYRHDLGHRVRSATEANIARCLRVRGIDYEYEPEEFEIEEVDPREPEIIRRSKRYIPDFKTGNGYIEVKGSWEGKSGERGMEKILRFALRYHHLNLMIVQRSDYRRFFPRLNLAGIVVEDYADWEAKYKAAVNAHPRLCLWEDGNARHGINITTNPEIFQGVSHHPDHLLVSPEEAMRNQAYLDIQKAPVYLREMKRELKRAEEMYRFMEREVRSLSDIADGSDYYFQELYGQELSEAEFHLNRMREYVARFADEAYNLQILDFYDLSAAFERAIFEVGRLYEDALCTIYGWPYHSEHRDQADAKDLIVTSIKI